MRLVHVAAAAAVALLAGCGQGGNDSKTQAVAEAASSGAPSLFQASYRLEAQAFPDDGSAPAPIVMVRDGRNTRMEVTQPGEGTATIVFRENEAFILADAAGQRVAMRMPTGTVPTTPDEEWEKSSAELRRVGDCSVIGEQGVEWESTDTGAGSRGTACITADGVILKATENGRTVWEATRLERGPQDPSQFGVPEGYEILDMGAMMQGAADALSRMGVQQAP